jgi:hypothetical protein
VPEKLFNFLAMYPGRQDDAKPGTGRLLNCIKGDIEISTKIIQMPDSELKPNRWLGGFN